MNQPRISSPCIRQNGLILLVGLFITACTILPNAFPDARLVEKGGRCTDGDGAIHSPPGWTSNNRIFAARGCGGVVIFDPKINATEVIPNSKEVSCASISFDNEHLVFTDSNESGIFVMNTNGTGRIRLTKDDSNSVCPKWSPDGSRIAFSSKQSGTTQLYIMHSDGSKVSQLTFPPLSADNLNWSPSGESIVFSDNTSKQIYLVSPNGSNPKLVTDGQSKNMFATWSSNGNWLFYFQSSAPTGFYAIRPDGTGKHFLYDAPFTEYPTFSPNGEYLAFIGTRLQEPGIFRDIYVMEVGDWFK